MLTNVQRHLAQHAQAAWSSFQLLLNKPMATLMTVLVLAITLVLPALFWVMADNLQGLSEHWQRGERISLYLKSSLSFKEEADFLLQIRGTDGVAAAHLKTPEEGLAFLQQQEGMQDIMRYLPENPLPAMVDVLPSVDLIASNKLGQLYEKLKAYPQVDQAKLDLQWVERLRAVLGFVTSFSQALMALLALAVVLIIGNTLRLAIHNRYEEIQVLKLIGAKNSFIVRPFLYSGIWYGFLAALFAVLLVNLFLMSLSFAVSQLATVYQMHYALLGLTLRQMLLLLGFAVSLGWLGACLSVKKQLAAIEPC